MDLKHISALKVVASRRSTADEWLSENLDALESSNRYVETNGLPLRQYARVLGRTLCANSDSADTTASLTSGSR